MAPVVSQRPAAQEVRRQSSRLTAWVEHRWVALVRCLSEQTPGSVVPIALAMLASLQASVAEALPVSA